MRAGLPNYKNHLKAENSSKPLVHDWWHEYLSPVRINRTGQCMNHAPAIVAARALIYSTHWVLYGLLLPIVIFVVYCERYLVIPCYKFEPFDGRCVFAVAAYGVGACFSLTFWTVWRPLAWCIIRPCIQYTAGVASMAGAWFIHWLVRGLYGPPVADYWLVLFSVRRDRNQVQ